MTLRAVQLFWPDVNGRFPFQPNCDAEVHRLQPRTDLAMTPDELEELEAESGDL